MADANIANLIARLLENNIFWRVIRHKRKLPSDISISLNASYKCMLIAEQKGSGYKKSREILESQVSYYENKFYNVENYKKLLEG